MPAPDTSSRFIFENADIRGSFVRLDQTFIDIVGDHGYSADVTQLLGEFLAANFLLRDTIKFEGRLTLQVTGQANSDAPIKMLMVESTHLGTARGIVQMEDPAHTLGDFNQLLGDGLLAVTVEPDGKERYQSLVPLEGDNLATCLTHYFAQSDQLGTVIKLFANDSGAGGMLLQQLPRQLEPDEKLRAAHWHTIATLGATLEADEMFNLDNHEILHRLFARENETINLVSEDQLSFACSCSEQRFAGALLSLGADELEQIFTEDPVVRVSCEFCQTRYSFDQAALTRWASGDQTVH